MINQIVKVNKVKCCECAHFRPLFYADGTASNIGICRNPNASRIQKPTRGKATKVCKDFDQIAAG